MFEIESNQQYQANDACNNNPGPGRKLSVEAETHVLSRMGTTHIPPTTKIPETAILFHRSN